MPQAWSIVSGSGTVNIGIIDSGIDTTHPDLIGHVDTSLSKSYIDGESPFDDDEGHGTSVAGIINSITNDATGLAGTGWQIKLVSLKIRHGNYHTTADFCDALNYAQSKGIDILVCSLELLSHDNLQTAIDSYPGLIICAAGNDGHDLEFASMLPDSLDCENLLVVGASDENDKVAEFAGGGESNVGSVSVDIFAPGSLMTVCHPTSLCVPNADGYVADGYYNKEGTSLAAPYVAGVAALMRVKHPSMTPAEIKGLILNSAEWFYEFDSLCTSDGRLDAYNAVLALSHYDDHYTYIGSKHRAYCSCGLYIEELHTFVQSGMVVTCIKCNHEILLQNIEPELEIE